MTPRARLMVAAALFLGWISWLGVTALTKSRAPLVSRAQAAAATVPVLARLTDGVEDREAYLIRRAGQPGQMAAEVKEKAGRPAVVVEVVESFRDGPAAGTKVGVSNLPTATGYSGEGRYLLLLTREDAAHLLVGDKFDAYTLVGQQRSPGSDLADVGPPTVYLWTDRTDGDLRKQVKRLFP